MTEAKTLDDLFADLAAAVAKKDRDRAYAIAAMIEQRLFEAAIASDAQLQRLRKAMAPLDAPAEAPEIVFPPPDQFGQGQRPQVVLPENFWRDDELTRSGDAGEDERGVDFPVWFATNRKAEGQGFSGERAETTTRGQAIVHVPKAHRFGETGSAWWKRLLRGDDRLRLKSVAQLARDAFYAGLGERIESARHDGDEPEALIFLHGFNNSFEDAAIRAAQIGCDLGVPGPTAFFSWPSRGSLFSYSADEASIEASEGAIADFLVEFAQNCGAGKIHIIAHSMGNRGLLRALQRINADAEMRTKVRFNQIILAAPDVDRDLFIQLAYLYSAQAQRATLYASRRDLAVFASSILHSAARAGYYTPYTVTSGVDTIATPNFNVDLLGHGYFAQAEALLHDIYDLLRYNEPPRKRQRIQEFQAEGEQFWTFKR
jgi:esterase/lipase superfamily enzyme